MELKLQQAIVATRAGRTDVAQSLLTQLIHENPDDANAWFLLGHIVDTPERQALYLQRTLELEPEHVIAKHQLIQLENGPVPAPMIPQQLDSGDQTESVGKEATTVQALVEPVPELVTVAELSQGLQDLDDTHLEAQTTPGQPWTESAGQPIREKNGAQAATTLALQNGPPSPTELESNNGAGEVWLVRILVIMVIVAAIVLGILVLLILI